MGGEMLEMGVKIRKVMMFTIRRFHRSVRNHPFLVVMLCLLVLLYRSSPFVFSLLVSASPVLICTALLLGTLLSFGQPNIPEIERDEKINHEIASLRTGVSGDAIVVEQKDSYSIERVTYQKGDAVEQLNEELNSVTNRTSELHMGDSSASIAPLIQARFQEMKFENEVIEGGGRELDEPEYEQKNKINNERLGGEEAKTDDEDLELENDKSPAESFDSERVNVDSLDSPPGSPWKHVEEGEEQEEEEDEADDSGSDRAESSSPDASMADIIPMLDELHPLLDEDSPQPLPLSHDGSDAASERSAKSSESSSEADDNIEKHEELEAADEDNEDADDDDEAQGSKECQTKSAITWTEEDQKNLMDLGSSELERNQRLESLIARRRARKTMSMMPERNLIDLESVDLAFNIAPISTARNNPFDLPHDSYDNTGLPPIPGSAPSILSQRRNPFDLPYDSSEEKPDLMGDSFQREFKAFQPKEPFFRRHESFNVGLSFFGPGRQDRKESRFRPYFVPERMDSEGTSYSPSFQRQFSGLSDSKASSVPETDSVVSAGDIDDKNLIEEDISHPAELLNSVPEIELRGLARELEDKNLSEEDVSEEPELMLKKEDRNLSEGNISQGTEVISKMERVSEHVGHGSQSSEEEDSLGEVEKIDIGAHSENHHEVEQMVFEEGGLDNLVQHDQADTCLKEDLIKQGYRSASSSSSLLEISERIFSERDAEGLSGLEERRNDIVEDAGILRQHSPEGSDFGTRSVLVGDTPQKEPVYDTSPPAGRKNLSTSSSVSSDVHVESEMGLPPVLIKRTVSFAERESESSCHDIEKNIYDKEISAYSSLLHPLDENQSESTEAEISDHHTLKLDSSQAHHVADCTSAPAVAESTVNHASVDLRPHLDTSVEGDEIYQRGSHDYLENQIFNSVNVEAHDAVHGVQHHTVSSEDQDLAQSEKHLQTAFAEQVLDHNVPSTEDVSTVEHSVDKEVAFQPEQGQTLPSNSGTDLEAGHSVEPEEKQISAHNQNTSEGKAVSEFDQEFVFLFKSIDETSSRDNNEVQGPSVIQEGMVEELSCRDRTDVSGVQELEQDISPSTYSPASPESISIPSEAYESRGAEDFSDVENNSVDEFDNTGQLQTLEARNFSVEAFNSQVDVQNTYDVEDEIKEIDEVLLSELDTVGDFSIKDYYSGLDAFEKHVASGGESSSVPHVMKPSGSAVDGNSIDLHERQPTIHSENLRSSQFVDIDTHGEEVKSVSGPQTSGTSVIQHTDISSGHLIQGEIQSSDDLKLTEMVTLPSENEIELESSRVVQCSNPDISPGMPVVEARSIEDIESMFRKAELSLVKKETMPDGSEMAPVGDFSVKDYDSGLDAFEKHVASGRESSSVLHMMKPSGSAVDGNFIDLNERQPIIHPENLRSFQVVDIDAHGEEVKSGFGPQTFGTSAIQHSDISSGDLIQGKIQSSDNLKPTEMVTLPRENEIELESSRVVQYSNPDISTGMPVIEARSIEDIESMFRKAELSLVKKETMLDGSEMLPEDQVSEATSSGMPVLEARSLEDIDSTFKQMREKENEKPNISEPLQAQWVLEESNAMGFSYQEQHQDSSLTEPKMELPIVEPKQVEDDDFDLNQPYEEGNTHMLPGSVYDSLNVVSPKPSESPVMESRSLEESHQEKVQESNSFSRSREVETNKEGTSSHVQLSAKESHAQEISPSDENLDAEVGKPVVQLSAKEPHAQELSRSDENLDAEIGKPDGQLITKESHAQELSKVHENLDAGVEKPETSTTDIKGKGKKSRKSSSSSSSSSDSSSSDSDKE